MRQRNSNPRRLATQVAALIVFIGLLTCSDALVQRSIAQTNAQSHLYFFTNDGCAPCRQVEPAIEVLKHEGYPVTTIKMSEQPQSAARLGVDRTPTVIMISNNKMVGRHAGLIDAVTLKKWFSAVGIDSGSAFSSPDGKPPGRTKVPLGKPKTTNADPALVGFDPSTMHKGTPRPGNAREKAAMQASVRLKVEDAEGTSYATGTVIHSHAGESLVVTCGHVFRDAQGQGNISAEYGFGNGRPKSAPGELIFYDADARDIGLVSIRTPDHIEPVSIASRETSISRGRDIFSVGCDHGANPTIRRSRIKNRAAYDGAIKYDIHGRPVDGRSGGGLFTSSGELIGICNAAAVEVDEGIYTALDTIYWQLAKVNLDHLFDGSADPTRIADKGNNPVEMPVAGSEDQTFAYDSASEWRNDPQLLADRETRLAPIQPSTPAGLGRTDVRWDGASPQDQEVIILIRSTTDPANTEAITISDPTPKLLQYLDKMGDNSQSRQLDVARLRTINFPQDVRQR